MIDSMTTEVVATPGVVATQPGDDQKPKFVDPSEYGIEVQKGLSIENAFAPKVIEAEGYNEVYKHILTKEISKEVCQEARELRLKLMRVRTGIGTIHEAEKAYYIAAGKFCDALKKKLQTPISQMEEKLEEIEKHFENLEKQRLAKIEADRKEMIRPFVSEIDLAGMSFSNMPDDVFEAYMTAKKTGFEQRQKEEALRQKEIEDQRAEAEKKAAESETFRTRLSKFEAVTWNGQEAISNVDNKTVVITYEDMVGLPDYEFYEIVNTHNNFVEAEREKFRQKKAIENHRRAELTPVIPFIGPNMTIDEIIGLDNEDYMAEFERLTKQKHIYDEAEKAKKERARRRDILTPLADYISEIDTVVDAPETVFNEAVAAAKTAKAWAEKVMARRSSIASFTDYIEDIEAVIILGDSEFEAALLKAKKDKEWAVEKAMRQKTVLSLAKYIQDPEAVIELDAAAFEVEMRKASKLHAEAEENERKLKSAPDRQKLVAFARTIEGLPFPVVDNDDAKACLKKVETALRGLVELLDKTSEVI